MARRVLKCGAFYLVTRRDAKGQTETLVFNQISDRRGDYELRPLEGVDLESFALGPPLSLLEGVKQRRYQFSTGPWSPVYEPVSNCVYWMEYNALLRLDSANIVTVAAGNSRNGRVDGPGNSALFDMKFPFGGLAADYRGSLYLADRNRVCKVTVTAESSHVTTCYEQREDLKIESLAYDIHHSVLLGSTETAVYKLQPAGQDGSLQPVLIAGKEGYYEERDGVGSDARFLDTWLPMGVDRTGRAFIKAFGANALRELDVSTGKVTTPVSGLLTSYGLPFILPHGCLAMRSGDGLAFLLDGLQPAYDFSAAPPPTAPSASASDEETEDQLIAQLQDPVVVIRVAGKSFFLHRSLLSQRSDYFARLLCGSFAEGGAVEVELPEADPDAFGCLVASFYHGELRVPDRLLRSVAELAGRLLLPDAVAQLQPRLLAAACPATVVSDMLWAERHGLTELLPHLQSLFLERSKEVVGAAPDWAQQLIAGSPGLTAELLNALASGEHKAGKTP